jgi:hypothetical protein
MIIITTQDSTIVTATNGTTTVSFDMSGATDQRAAHNYVASKLVEAMTDGWKVGTMVGSRRHETGYFFQHDDTSLADECAVNGCTGDTSNGYSDYCPCVRCDCPVDMRR